MATILDIGLLEHFQIIFPFLLVFALSLVALGRLKAFQDNKALHALVAIVLAFMTLFSKIAVSALLTMAPWFVLFFILAIFGYILALSVGYSDKNIMDTLAGPVYGKMFGYLVFIAVMIIFFGSISYTFSTQEGFLDLTQNTTINAGSEQAGFFAILVNPQVLGMILILIIAVVTILKMTEA